jgi:hypothetical protein
MVLFFNKHFNYPAANLALLQSWQDFLGIRYHFFVETQLVMAIMGIVFALVCACKT